jgi:hypothetical protein
VITAHDPSRIARLQPRSARTPLAQSKSRRAGERADFHQRFSLSGYYAEFYGFQRMFRCVLWKYGHRHSANIKQSGPEFLLTRNSDVEKKGGNFPVEKRGGIFPQKPAQKHPILVRKRGNHFDEWELAAIRKGRAQVLEISFPRADTPPHTN